MSRRPQATKANRAQVLLHIRRQRRLGERMIGDWDQPTRLDLAVTGLALLALAFL
jgi:hypothetical protein